MRASTQRLAAEFRTARVGANVSLREIAKAVGTSHHRVARFERGELESTDLDFAGACCAVVGLELSVKAYPSGDPIRDRAHAALLERLRRELPASLRWRFEVPLPIERDLRAWDAVIAGPGWVVHVEAETRVTDGQALLRRLGLKVRDGARGPTVLLVADTRLNRQALATLRPAFRELLPLDARPILAALREGREPPGSGVVVL